MRRPPPTLNMLMWTFEVFFHYLRAHFLAFLFGELECRFGQELEKHTEWAYYQINQLWV